MHWSNIQNKHAQTVTVSESGVPNKLDVFCIHDGQRKTQFVPVIAL